MTTIDVELARQVDGPDLVAALAAQGLVGEAVGEHVLVHVPDDSVDGVTHLLDAWIGDSGLPLVPIQLGRHSFAVMPPAA